MTEIFEMLKGIEKVGFAVQPRKDTLSWHSSLIFQFTITILPGWIFAIFNDAGEVDYFEWIISPMGKVFRFEDFTEAEQDFEIETYLPVLCEAIRNHV